MTADVAAGAAAGFAAYTIATPLETLKTLVQAEGGRTRSALGRVVTSSGKRGLFRGLGAMWAGGVPYSMLLYGIYQPVKAWTHSALVGSGGRAPSREEIFVADACAAALAELAGLFFFVPGRATQCARPHRAPSTRCTADPVHRVWHRCPATSSPSA